MNLAAPRRVDGAVLIQVASELGPRALLCLATELRYVPLALPKLHIMTAHEVLGIFFCGIIVWAQKFYGPNEHAIRTNKCRPDIQPSPF
jgi:hypothetical protein